MYSLLQEKAGSLLCLSIRYCPLPNIAQAEASCEWTINRSLADHFQGRDPQIILLFVLGQLYLHDKTDPPITLELRSTIALG